MRVLIALVVLVVSVCVVLANDCSNCQTIWNCKGNCSDLYNATAIQMKKDHWQIIKNNSQVLKLDAKYNEQNSQNHWITGIDFRGGAHGTNTTCNKIFAIATLSQGSCTRSEGVDKVLKTLFKSLPHGSECTMSTSFGC
eukprot:TRINITY_DN7508_c0_g1_i1.p1 TRINITY_DN7508_c0_g1~~TRINITY_DN7508_c0_g1_i1.p1  ORF type:complete len:139 (-),score=12.83 TRINITY_DN7508_c0_g1_i1:41-457(-)